jgi:hypothetical protein
MTAIVITVLFVGVLVFTCYGLHEACTAPCEWGVYEVKATRPGREFRSFAVHRIANRPAVIDLQGDTVVTSRLVSEHSSYTEAADAYGQYTAY